MNITRRCSLLVAALLVMGGCATRPTNPPITLADATAGYRFETRLANAKDKEDLVILAFSGGGTRAAAFPTACWSSCARPR
jgi:NTE family protein